MSSVSVLIVNYNGAQFIGACIESVLASKGLDHLDIVVVDNCSTDDSLQVLSQYKDQVTLVKNNHNSGFSKGNNIAAQYAAGEYYFLLNNDTVVDPDTIQLLAHYLAKHPDIGALAPKLLNEDGTTQCPGSILGQWKFKSPNTQDMSFLSGAALLMRATIYQDIGGLDENLFFYNEDIDLCKTILAYPLRLVYYPHASLIHVGGLSTTFRKEGSIVEGYRGGFYVCHKHYPAVIFLLYRCVVLLDIMPKMFFHAIVSFFKPTHWQYVRAYFKVLMINIKKDVFVQHPEIDVEVMT